MSMPKGDGYVIGFSFVICILCSLLLSATASVLKERQDYNVEIDRKMNVLKAFGVDITHEDGGHLTADEIERYFRDHISELVLDGASGQVLEGVTSSSLKADEVESRAKLPLYVWREEGVVRKYAFPVSGKGLWSTIYGYLSLDANLSEIVGVTFYKHGETPGLGGEVETDWFQRQFPGKKVFADGQRLKFEVVKGKVADRYPGGSDHAVDGISGATITGNGVTKFINRDLDRYEKYFSAIRRG